MSAPTDLTGVSGVRAAHWTHESGTTGVTLAVFPQGARAGVAVPGHAPGGREHGAMDPTHIAGSVHALCLTGGSAFGLAAADGVARELETRGVGFDTGAGRVPIVPAAVLFDLPVARARPDAASGEAATALALDHSLPLSEGRVGAGAGARVGKAFGAIAPGGSGNAGRRVGAWDLAVVVVVNAFGGVRDPRTGGWLAGGPQGDVLLDALPGDWRGNTTLAIVCTDAPLDRAGCSVLARMATAGLARAIDPVFTPFDGDTVFAAATGSGDQPGPVALARLGAAAADALAEAVVRAVRAGASQPAQADAVSG